MAQGFGLVDQAVKSITTVEEYINVGMEIANEVAMDFVENNKEEAEKHAEKFQKVMLEFVKMERDLQQFQQAVDHVKQTAGADQDVNLEGMLDEKLEELKSANTDKELQRHEKMQSFNNRILEAVRPDGSTVPQPSTSDADIEMTQESVNTKCPYTGKEMVIPMTNTICNHMYDRDGIKEYIKQKKNKARCPLSGCPNQNSIKMSDLVENKDLRKLIERKSRRKNKK